MNKAAPNLNSDVKHVAPQHGEVHHSDFHAALKDAHGTSDNVKNFVHLYEPHEYSNMKTFLSPDKKSGYAVKPDGDLVSVFSTAKGRGDHIMTHAMQNGASKLDAFDGYLPKFYEKHGFQEYKREKNWTPGGPDVVYMHKPDAKKLAASEADDGLHSHAANKSDFYKQHNDKKQGLMATGMIYLAVDGDSAGQLVGRAVLANDEQALHEISQRINHGQDVIEHWAEANGGVLISAGGDEGNVKVPAEAIHAVEGLRADYAYAIKLTLTVGAGSNLSEAGKALMVGKLRGKDQLCQYDQTVEAEYAKAQQEAEAGTATGEAKKLGDAYMKNNTQPMKESEDAQAAQAAPSHDDCPYCKELADTQTQDEDHCQYCHDLDSGSEEHTCEYCQAYDAKNQHDPNAEGHTDDCPYCQESAAQTQAPQEAAPEDSIFQDAAPQDGSLVDDQVSPQDVGAITDEMSNQDDVQQENPQGIVPDLDGHAGDDMQNNVSRPEGFGENTPQDMGMSEDGAPDAGPDLSGVLKEGLDSHADNIQREKVVNMISEALEGFKASKNILEKAKEQAPQLYQSHIAMLKAMIEMARMLGLNEQQGQEQAPQEAAPTDSSPQNPQSSPQGEAPAGKIVGR